MKFCDTEKSSLCKLCNEANEDLEHFLLKCKTLDPVRLQILDCITQPVHEYTGKSFYGESSENKLNILLNLNSTQVSSLLSEEAKGNTEFHSRRLCSALHVERIRVVSAPGRFGPGSFRPESFRPGSFRPILGVGRFGLGRWVVSANFLGESIRP